MYHYSDVLHSNAEVCFKCLLFSTFFLQSSPSCFPSHIVNSKVDKRFSNFFGSKWTGSIQYRVYAGQKWWVFVFLALQTHNN